MIETEKKNAVNKVTETRKKIKLAQLDLQQKQNLINRLEKIEVYAKSKPVKSNQPNNDPINSKLPIA